MRESSLAGPTFQKAQQFGSPGRSAHRAKLTNKTSENNPANVGKRWEEWTVKHLHMICCLSGPCSRSAFWWAFSLHCTHKIAHPKPANAKAKQKVSTEPKDKTRNVLKKIKLGKSMWCFSSILVGWSLSCASFSFRCCFRPCVGPWLQLQAVSPVSAVSPHATDTSRSSSLPTEIS